MKKRSEYYGWDPTKLTQPEQCICCKDTIPVGPGEMAFISDMPRSRNYLCDPCHREHTLTGRSLFGISRYRPEGRIDHETKLSRAAVSRELAKRDRVRA